MFDAPYLPLNPRTRKVAETARWTARTWCSTSGPTSSPGACSWCPRTSSRASGGRWSSASTAATACRGTRSTAQTAYHDFGAALAERGFIIFAPHNLYRGEDRYRWLDRKANTVKRDAVLVHPRAARPILDWLGVAAVRRPGADRVLRPELRRRDGGAHAAAPGEIRLSICSGDFNEWTRKVAATDSHYSFMRTIEWEMPYWNWGHTFDYAEMAYLMVPRPFMVERGHHDRRRPR